MSVFAMAIAQEAAVRLQSGRWTVTFSSVDETEESKRARRLELARKAFKEFSAQCFWSYRDDLEITEEKIPFVVRGLRLHGGHKGYKIAAELCR